MFSKDKFNLKNVLNTFYSSNPMDLSASDLEDVLEAIVVSYKNNPEQLQVELLKYFYKYLSCKNEHRLLDILNFI